MKRPQYVFRPNLNDPQHRRAWALLQQVPPAKRKEFLVQSMLYNNGRWNAGCGESRTSGVKWGKIRRLLQRITYHYKYNSQTLLPRKQGKKKTVTGQAAFVRSIYIFIRRRF